MAHTAKRAAFGIITIAALAASLANASGRRAHANTQWYVRADGSVQPGCGAANDPCKTISLILAKPEFTDGEQINVLSHAAPIIDSMVINRSTAIVGEGSAAIIDGGASRVISVTSGVSVTLQNVTVRNGNTPGNGGGIYNAGTLSLVASSVLTNTAEFGGGIYNTGVMILTGSRLGGNLATGTGFVSAGGGVYNTGSLTLIDTDLTSNRVDHSFGQGGAIENVGGSVKITGGVLRFNKATYGAGIDNFAGGEVTLGGSVVRDNTGVLGGGLSNDGSVMNVNASAIVGNKSSSGGGGIYNSSVLTLTNVTLSGNEDLAGRGAAIDNESALARADLTHISIVANLARNTAAADASALFMGAGSRLSMRASLLAGSAPRNCFAEAGSTNTSAGFNISADASCAWLAQPSDAQSTDPGVGALIETGGTLVHPLRSTGAALNAIDAPSCALTADQRGVARPQLGRCDAGAFESQPVNLSLNASIAPATTYAGGDVTATVVLTHVAGEVATGVVVTGVLPAGTSFRTCLTSRGACTFAAGVVKMTFGDLALGEVVSASAGLTLAQPGPLALQFQASSNEPDDAPTDNSATASMTVLSSADLGVDVRLPQSIVGGNTVTYTIVAQNYGASTAASPMVTVSLPADVTFVRASGVNWQCAYADAAVVCEYQLAQMPVGEAPIAIVFAVPKTQTMLVASSGVESATYDPVETNNNVISSAFVEVAYMVRLPVVLRQ